MWQELTGFNFRDVADRALNSQANMSMFTRKANEHFAQCMASLEHYEEKQQLAAVASLTKQSTSLTTLAKQVMDARRRRAHMKRAPTPPGRFARLSCSLHRSQWPAKRCCQRGSSARERSG
jgi:hypothetical protein